MTSYHDRGIAINLFTTELEKSISKSSEINGGDSEQRTAQEVIEFLEAVEHKILRTIPVGRDPATQSTLHFFHDEDEGHPATPFWTVVSGPTVKHNEEDHRSPRSETEKSYLERRGVGDVQPPKIIHNYHWTTRLAQSGIGLPHGQQSSSRVHVSSFSQKPKPEPLPEALFLKIELNEKAFLPTFGTKNEYLDLKIDVFFNGDLCGSTYITETVRTDGNAKAGLIHYYGGRRELVKKERPWIVVPTTYGSNSGARWDSRGTAEPEQRWKKVNRALSQHADLHRHLDGELSKIGAYFSSLARQRFPEDAKPFLKYSASNFGIIDVVISAGNGKTDPSWAIKLSKPKGMRTDMDEVPREWTAERAEWMAQDIKKTLQNRPVTLAEVKAKRARENATTTAKLDPNVRRALIALPFLETPSTSRGGDAWSVPGPFSTDAQDTLLRAIDTQKQILKGSEVIQGRTVRVEDTSQYPLTNYLQWMKEDKPVVPAAPVVPAGPAAKEGEESGEKAKNEPTALSHDQDVEMTDLPSVIRTPAANTGNAQQTGGPLRTTGSSSGWSFEVLPASFSPGFVPHRRSRASFESTSHAHPSSADANNPVAANTSSQQSSSTNPIPYLTAWTQKLGLDASELPALATSMSKKLPGSERHHKRNKIQPSVDFVHPAQAPQTEEEKWRNLANISAQNAKTKQAFGGTVDPPMRKTRGMGRTSFSLPNVESSAIEVDPLQAPESTNRPGIQFQIPSKTNSSGNQPSPGPSRLNTSTARAFPAPVPVSSATWTQPSSRLSITGDQSLPTLSSVPTKSRKQSSRSTTTAEQSVPVPTTVPSGSRKQPSHSKTIVEQSLPALTSVPSISGRKSSGPQIISRSQAMEIFGDTSGQTGTPPHLRTGSSSTNPLPSLMSSSSSARPVPSAAPRRSVEQPEPIFLPRQFSAKGKEQGKGRTANGPAASIHDAAPETPSRASSRGFGSSWRMAPLSEGSVATYADRLRDVKEERPGWFREKQIVVGMRFMVVGDIEDGRKEDLERGKGKEGKGGDTGKGKGKERKGRLDKGKGKGV